MKGLLHFPDPVSLPDALFWEDGDGELRCAEAETTPSLAGAWTTLSAKDPGRGWEEYFDRLAERNPNPAVWERVDLEEGTPEEVLAALRSRT